MVLREACAVDRPRCAHCRNPIKAHQVPAGPSPEQHPYHEDCWGQAQDLTRITGRERQQEYERSIATGGLVALLSPYVSVVPDQREPAEPEPLGV